MTQTDRSPQQAVLERYGCRAEVAACAAELQERSRLLEGQVSARGVVLIVLIGLLFLLVLQPGPRLTSAQLAVLMWGMLLTAFGRVCTPP